MKDIEGARAILSELIAEIDAFLGDKQVRPNEPGAR